MNQFQPDNNVDPMFPLDSEYTGYSAQDIPEPEFPDLLSQEGHFHMDQQIDVLCKRKGPKKDRSKITGESTR